MCDIKDDVKDALKEFRFRKNQNNAALLRKFLIEAEERYLCFNLLFDFRFLLTVKIDRAKKTVFVDELIEVHSKI